MSARILIVDDDATQRNLLYDFLSNKQYKCQQAKNAIEALKYLENQDFDMVIMDVQMPRVTGLEALKIIRESHPCLSILLITAYADIRDAVTAIKDGALDYLSKPIDLKELLVAIEDALGSYQEQKAGALDLPTEVIAHSHSFRSVLSELKIVAPSEASILITGESGTGKEVLADLAHHWSNRKDQPLIKVNCAAIPENLMESELFGHEKGAFTGAYQRREGYFQAAHGGTLFLDEIAEMALPLQAKLLRVLQDGKFQRLGNEKMYYSDIRLITATNQDLEKAIAEGKFREDLLYRLNVIHLFLPPLRERQADILPLARHLVREFAKQKTRFSREAEWVIENYSWPGNVRELRNVIERACLLSRGDIIFPEQFPNKIRPDKENLPVSKDALASGTIEDMERVTILKTLGQTKGNRTQTAQKLGISRRGLLYKLQKYKEQGYLSS